MADKRNAAASRTGSRHRSCMAVVAVVCAVLILLVGLLWLLRRPKEVDITIQGQQIQPQLFDQIMRQQVSDVIYEFRQRGLERVDGTYWDTVCGGETPGAYLMELTLGQLRRLVAIYDMAQATGTPLEGGVNGIFDRMEAENQGRAEKQEAGQPVYGLSEFTFQTYLEYEVDWLEKQYCADPAHPGMQVTEDEREAYYQKNLETDFKLPDGISFSYLYMDTNFMDPQQADNLTSQLRELEQAARNGQRLEEAVEQYPDLLPYFEPSDIQPDQAASHMDSMGDVLDLAYTLEPGEQSGVVEANGGVYLVQCTARTYDNYLPLDQVADSIDTALRQQRYTQMVQSKAKALKLVGDQQEVLDYVINQMRGDG